MPAVTIVTPLFDKAQYIRDTVASVAAQTMSDWEMLVVDNGSTDGGPEIVRGFKDKRVQLLHCERRGPGAARNVGVRAATAEWVLFLDADDLLEPTYLADRISAATPIADVIAGPWQEFRGQDPQQPLRRQPAGFGATSERMRESAIATAPWVVHAAIVRRRLVVEGNEWAESLDNLPSEDAAFWFGLLEKSEICWSPAAGALYRVSTPGSRDALSDVAQRTEGLLQVIEYNVALLRRSGKAPTATQCAQIVRVLENAWRQSKKAGNRNGASTVVKRAEEFLSRARTESIGMLVRSIVGLERFNRFRLALS